MKAQIILGVCSLAVSSCVAIASNHIRKPQIVEKYEAAPLVFAENRGQAPKGIDFVSSGLDRRILTRRSGVDIYLAGRTPHTSHKISITLQNAQSRSAVKAAEPSETRSGFLYDGKLVEGLLNYRKVRYENVWRGIDVIYYGTGHDLEYDFVLQPGADPRKIRMSFNGIDSLRVDSAGNLLVGTPARDIVQHKPRIYQRSGNGVIEVAGQYRIGPGQLVSLNIGKYDRAKELVIDPVLAYKNASVDATANNIYDTVADAAGNVYVTGQTYGLGQGGVTSFFLIKLDPSGNRVGSAFEGGGTGGNTWGNALALDGAGNIYIAGQTAATGLISTCTPGCGFQSTLGNTAGMAFDGFLIAFSAAISPTYITYIGGSGTDVANSVAALGPTAVYVAGTTSSSNFPISSGMPALRGTQNAFLVKVDTTVAQGLGSRVWARYVGGTASDEGLGVVLDGSGNAYLIGTTTSLPTTYLPGSTPPQGYGFNITKTTNSKDGFLQKIDSTGQYSLFFTYFANGVPASEVILGNDVYVTGTTAGSLGNITANAAQATFGGGGADAFVYRVDTSKTGNASLIYASYLGGAGHDIGRGIAADANGKAYLVGSTTGGFPVVDAIQSTFGGGSSDPFYAVINTNATGSGSLQSSTYLGTAANDVAGGIFLQGTSVYICGYGGGAFATKIVNAAIGDFDGNGVPDLVWQNESTRQVTVHYYSGSGGVVDTGWNWLYPGLGAAGWHVVAVADFNSDGVADLVWQNDTTRQVTVHYYGGAGGATDQGWNWLYPGLGAAGWHVVAAADFNGDGVPDLVWQNDDTRQVTVNYYAGAGGATNTGWNWLYPGLGAAGWHVVAAADFDGNGVPDLVWQNDTTGQVTVHYYSGDGGAVDSGWNFLNFAGAVGWNVVGAVDLDNNGVPDLIWQKASTGEVTVNYYGGQGGATYLGWNWLFPSSSAAGWRALN